MSTVRDNGCMHEHESPREHSAVRDPFPITLPAGTRPVGEGLFAAPGDLVRWRFRRLDFDAVGGEVVQPMRVVRDDPRGMVLWLAGGTATADLRVRGFEDLNPHEVDHAVRFVPVDRAPGRVPILRRWHGRGVLRIVPAGMPFSVWVFRTAEGRFRGWYVNLEHRHRRLGIADLFTSDHILDLVIDPDGTVRRKDDDELASAVRYGMWTEEIAQVVEEHARLALAEFAAGHWAFSEEWTRWDPDPAWPVPGPEAVAAWVPAGASAAGESAFGATAMDV